MTSVQVVWLPPSREKWSGGLLQHLFDGRLWKIPGVEYRQVSPRSAAKGEPAVVIMPGEEWAQRAKVAELNRYLDRFTHVVLCVIADEGSTFPWQDVLHDSLRLWIQTPRPGVHPPASDDRFYFGFGWHPDTPDVLRAADRTKRDDWFFAGQITHDSRRELADVLRGMPGGTLIETDGFAQGIDRRAEYLPLMARARVVPCPSGPLTPDSFRLYEALEAGAVPIVETTCPGYDSDEYWRLVYGRTSGRIPSVEKWVEFPDECDMAAHVSEWPVRVRMWWEEWKRQAAWRMRDDVLGAETPVDGITIIITSSIIPSHPALDVVRETLASIAFDPALRDAEVLVMCDGLPDDAPDVEHDRYNAYRAAAHRPVLA